MTVLRSAHSGYAQRNRKGTRAAMIRNHSRYAGNWLVVMFNTASFIEKVLPFVRSIFQCYVDFLNQAFIDDLLLESEIYFITPSATEEFYYRATLPASVRTA